MPGLNYRTAESSDIENIVSLVELAYRGEQSKQGWTTEADFIDGQRTDNNEVSALIEDSQSVILLCYDKRTLVASLHLHNNNNDSYLGMFAVEPSSQGKGIGAALLKQAEAYAKEYWDSEKMKMSVITIRKALVEWYLRHGYKKTGQFKPFPYGQEQFGIPKRDDLQLEVLEKSLK